MAWFKKKDPLEEFKLMIDELDVSLRSAAKGLSGKSLEMGDDIGFKELVKNKLATLRVNSLIPKYEKLLKISNNEEVVSKLDNEYKTKLKIILTGMEVFINTTI